MDQTAFSLADIENYHDGVDVDMSTVIEHAIIVVSLCAQKVGQALEAKPKNYKRFMVSKAVECLSSIIGLLFLYTANPPLVFYHAEKMIYFYIEFLQQIGNDVNHFLGLSSKDASIFTYKKTIYEVISSERKEPRIKNPNHNENCKRLSSVLQYIQTIVALQYNMESAPDCEQPTISAAVSSLAKKLCKTEHKRHQSRMQYLDAFTKLLSASEAGENSVPAILHSVMYQLSKTSTQLTIDEMSEEKIQVLLFKQSMESRDKIEEVAKRTLIKGKALK